jgi:hypothetical protein
MGAVRGRAMRLRPRQSLLMERSVAATGFGKTIAGSQAKAAAILQMQTVAGTASVQPAIFSRLVGARDTCVGPVDAILGCVASAMLRCATRLPHLPQSGGRFPVSVPEKVGFRPTHSRVRISIHRRIS